MQIFYDAKKSFSYTGEQLRPLFNYQTFGVKGDSISAFTGLMTVSTEHLVDMEDVIEKEFIWSPKAINFIIEIFHIGIETAVLYQRAFMFCILDYLHLLHTAGMLYDKVEDISLRGDDLMIDVGEDIPRKLSVSIATVSPTSGLIHTGINIETDAKIPVAAIGLKDIIRDMTDKEIDTFIRCVTETFNDYVTGIKSASVKVRSVI